MTNTTTRNSTEVLKAIFQRNPNAGLHEIHQSHPLLNAMSLDHLGLRLGELIDSRRDRRTK